MNLPQHPDQERAGREILLRKLAASARSRAELATALSKAGIEGQVANGLLARFEELGLIDDVEYAQMVVRTQHARRGLVGLALAQELQRRGLSKEDASAAIATLDADQRAAKALELVQQRLRSMGGVPPLVQQRRIAAMLARKGYGADESWRAIRQAGAVCDGSGADSEVSQTDLE